MDIAHTHNFIAENFVTHNSIYGFRGADIGNILSFEKHYPNAKVIMLEQNYRSTQTILDVADAIISNNAGRKEKKLWTDKVDGEKIYYYQAFDADNESLCSASSTRRHAVWEKLLWTNWRFAPKISELRCGKRWRLSRAKLTNSRAI